MIFTKRSAASVPAACPIGSALTGSGSPRRACSAHQRWPAGVRLFRASRSSRRALSSGPYGPSARAGWPRSWRPGCYLYGADHESGSPVARQLAARGARPVAESSAAADRLPGSSRRPLRRHWPGVCARAQALGGPPGRTPGRTPETGRSSGSYAKLTGCSAGPSSSATVVQLTANASKSPLRGVTARSTAPKPRPRRPLLRDGRLQDDGAAWNIVGSP